MSEAESYFWSVLASAVFLWLGIRLMRQESWLVGSVMLGVFTLTLGSVIYRLVY